MGNPWLDAGIIPFSTLSQDPASRDYIDNWYPAAWFSESFPGQFRNWFYSLIAMSVALEGQRPADAVFSYALMRDEKGEEMHKSRGNSILFEDAADQIGVDVMRWLFWRQDPASNLNFGPRACSEVRRQFIIPLWNVYSFFVTYANLDGWRPEVSGDKEYSDMDRWILDELNRTIRAITDSMAEWRIELAAREMEQFADRLSNWYVRRSRRRFWKSQNDEDKSAAYATLHECLATLSKLLAPFAPFLAEQIYGNLVASQFGSEPRSVHLADWPTERQEADPRLVEDMRLVMRLVDMGRRARSKANVKVRQPLAELLVAAPEQRIGALGANAAYADMIKDELNIKEVRPMDAAMLSQLNNVTLRPNFAALGPKHGGGAKLIQRAFAEADADQHREWAAQLDGGGAIEVGQFKLAAADVLIQREDIPGYSVISEGGHTVALDTGITPEIRAEGWARELVHQIQNMRKQRKLEIADRINLVIALDPEAAEALRAHEEHIRSETLALALEWASEEVDGTEVKLDDQLDARVRLAKA